MPEQSNLTTFTYRSDIPNLVITYESTLYDDESVRTKLEVMDKWEAMIDDSRNDEQGIDVSGEVEAFLKLGKRYRITLILEELE